MRIKNAFFYYILTLLPHPLAREDNDSQYRSDNRQTHRTNSRRHSNHRSLEKPRRSCQSSDLALVAQLQYRSSADETDPGDDALNDSRQTVSRHAGSRPRQNNRSEEHTSEL